MTSFESAAYGLQMRAATWLTCAVLALLPAAGCPEADRGTVRDDGVCQPGNGIFAGGERRFGFCAGECAFELGISYPIVLDTDRCLTPSVSLSVHSQPQSSSRIISAELTQAAWQRAVEIGFALRAVRLETTYGCPDCVDGGSVSIVLDRPSEGLIDATYEYGNPPPVLADADALLQSLIDQLLACEGPDIVDCRR